jgi:hypothetical protein
MVQPHSGTSIGISAIRILEPGAYAEQHALPFAWLVDIQIGKVEKRSAISSDSLLGHIGNFIRPIADLQSLCSGYIWSTVCKFDLARASPGNIRNSSISS